jgi:2-keto-4-pentenoate hydratase/2-oxohepta-3-ene-1,7-dioic acid hydratase in catechol pathway
MKIGTVRAGSIERVALLTHDKGGFLLPRVLGDLVTIIESGPVALDSLKRAVADSAAETFDLAAVTLLAPIRRFRRDVLCTGWNYWDHFYESEGKREGQDVPKPDAPTFFTKAPDVVIGPNDDIAFDAKLSAKWDYEAEVVVIVGKTGRSIPQAKAMDHVFGYCLANDVSQRDLQRRHGGQWLKGKSIDGTMPLGPWITLREDIDISTVTIEFELNGKTMQRAGIADMAFPIPELIAELSSGMTLHAGDILLTGTPSGIGNARTPPVFLAEGDRLVTRGSGLGELVNTLRTVDLTAYRT